MTIEVTAEEYQAMIRGQRRKGVPSIKQSEREFQKSVTDLASDLGWTHYHTQYAPGSDAGYPDLTLVHPLHGVIWLELKTYRGVVSPEQIRWIETLQTAGQQAFVVFPDDGEFIFRLLKGEKSELEGVKL